MVCQRRDRRPRAKPSRTDRALHRDFIDVHAAAIKAGYTWPDLEHLGARHTPNRSLADLADRLSSIDLRDDANFVASGLAEQQIAELRHRAQAWADDILFRLAAAGDILREREATTDWNSYLDE
jgi:hypothetical protein